MKDEIFYEEISAIVAKVSTRTLKMKTNNVKLLNKIGFELSYILNKVNDIVRLYQADKNGIHFLILYISKISILFH